MFGLVSCSCVFDRFCLFVCHSRVVEGGVVVLVWGVGGCGGGGECVRKIRIYIWS